MNCEGEKLDQEIAENIFSGQLNTLMTMSINLENKNKHFFRYIKGKLIQLRNIYEIDQF
jgi:hypothetical protein